VELVILAPIIGVLLVAVVAVGRVENARADVEGAARSAARDPHAAIGRVQESTAAMVRVGEPGCRHFSFNATIGKTNVAVAVSCDADLDEDGILPLPGSISLRASASEIIDVFREGP
jgi:hypothetical protein